MQHNLFFVEHCSPDSVSPDTKSRTNAFEAEYAVRIASYLVWRRGYDAKDVTLLTLYVGQMFAIKRVREPPDMMSASEGEGVMEKQM